MTGVLSRIGREIIRIFLKLWYKDKKLFVIIITGLVLVPIASVMSYQEELNHSTYHNSALVFMLWILLLAGLYYKQINRSSRRSRRSSSYNPNTSSRYRETIRNVKNDQKELTKKQQQEIKRVTSELAKLESKMTSIMPKPIKTEQEQRTRNVFHKSASETDLEDNFSRFTPREMEELTGKLFENKGYSVEVTKQTGDFGIDVWATNENMKLGIQVKKWKSNVGFDDVSKTLGSNLGKANKYILISTDSFFTSQALEWQRQNSHMIELWDTNRFKKELQENGQIK